VACIHNKARIKKTYDATNAIARLGSELLGVGYINMAYGTLRGNTYLYICIYLILVV